MSYLLGQLYDALLEPLLYRWKSRLASWIAEEKKPTLDICCGAGMQCRMIANNSPVFGLDLNAELLKYARSRAPEIPYVCADAVRLPFKPGSFHNAVISLALHDKPEGVRRQMVGEAKKSLSPAGRLLIIDFERPSTIKAKIGYSLIYLIELMAGYEHFSNGREFVKSGGLKAFLQRHNLKQEKCYTSVWGSSSIIQTVPGVNCPDP